MSEPAPSHALASRPFSWTRVWALFQKETVQMRRDRLTFAIMIVMPIMQLLLFGYAINTDPRHLATVVERRDDGPMVRSFMASLQASTFFDVVAIAERPNEGEEMLRSGKAAFLVVIPEEFETRLVRGERPQILVASDASDPVASSGPLNAIHEIARSAFSPHLEGTFEELRETPPPYDIVTHRQYNPTGETAINIVPGLLGVILTMTMVMITSMALTREAERGTMETLLSTPARPVEIMLGKTIPYTMVGFIQTAVVLLAARVLFDVPFTGSRLALMAGLVAFMMANLMLGYLISTVARSQMQAMQLTFFVFLPSILLSGFMFPFRAMPQWAQAIGEALPITHFLRVIRATMLKSGDFSDIMRELLALGLILAALTTLALLRFRRTLD